MALPLLNFKQFSIDSSHWTAITIDVNGILFKTWLEFTADLKLRSDPNDASTEKLLLISSGNEFIVDCAVPTTIEQGQLLVYAQSAGGMQIVTLCSFVWRQGQGS